MQQLQQSRVTVEDEPAADLRNATIHGYTNIYQCVYRERNFVRIVAIMHNGSPGQRFCWVLCVGASWELIAFVLRSLGARDQQQIGCQIGGQLLFLLAPLWINAFAYMLSARLVYLVLPDKRVFRIKATALTKIFVTMDVVCFLVQGAGGAMMSNAEVASDDPILRTGKQVYMIGCGLQLAFIIVFCGLMGRFYVKMRRAQRFNLNLKRIGAMVLVICLCNLHLLIPPPLYDRTCLTRRRDERTELTLILRGDPDHLSVGRVRTGGEHGQPDSDKRELRVRARRTADGVALVLLNAVHPGIVLRGDNSEFPRLSRQEKKQVKLERKAAKRESKLAKKAAREQKKKKKEKAAGLEVDSDEGDYVAMEERPLAADEYDSNDRTGARGSHHV
ncbi:RTA1 domain-containing protein [Colletotrichum cuscutae]|uniref:RTA1 domain-containing protein n=1 Tax=Colletotrichum cuscutae TaxID=1209917 RepID=A0AAI9TZK9_9PEZI|nr:RTA1 domain-containing protein [Colletotrichum cuscutae]